MPELDDDTVGYILETRKHFEDLRQVAAQLAGLLVLSSAGAKTPLLDHPTLHAAEELYREAADGVRRSRVTPRARRHHHHLLQAAESIRSALEAAHSSPEIDPVLARVRAGYAALQNAAGALPGFEMVAFAQGCCAPRSNR
ncbi:MAG TPA: hypothetical protein VJ732_11355 [Bryobacteraceae bacterium]|nr:hypothetical protein [Bryobacteraceae bacterium]